MNIISIIITQIPILGASALFAAGSVVMGIAKSKEVGAYDKMKIMVMERMTMMEKMTMAPGDCRNVGKGSSTLMISTPTHLPPTSVKFQN